jgi:sialate O-acetylesterase
MSVFGLADVAAAQSITLNPLLSDHAVLQRDTPMRVEGTAAANERITVQLGTKTQVTTSDAAGRWSAELPARPAGGPFDLVVTDAHGGIAKAADMMVGDVWLCSGQSNMELPVSRSLNADAEIKAAVNASIRLLTISHDSTPATRADFATQPKWSTVTPESVATFSAACYYFARDLQKKINVPMGLIHSSWGGSNIEAWIGADALRHAGDYDTPLHLNAVYARDPQAAMAEMATLWQDWWHKAGHDGSSPWQPDAAGNWKSMPLPWRNWKTWDVASLASYDGLVWFRRTVTLSAAQAAQAATFDTGAVDEEDQTWVNGVAVGNSFGWGEPRHYAVPAGTLHAGANSLVVNVYSAYDKGGMFGPAEAVQLKLADGSVVPLGSDWQYWQPSRNLGAPPHAPWHSIGGLTGMYNAMIAPLGHPALKGVLWYQGESNTGNAPQYEHLLDTLKAGWRAQFGTTTPFLIVQLPNFGKPNAAPVASGWAEVRDAERRSVASDPLAALAVTIDLGLDNELHPPNKQGVGTRLARAAESLIYHAPMSPSGPLPVSATRQAGQVVVRFKGVDGALSVRGGGDLAPFELCGADQSTCTSIAAKIIGNTVALPLNNPASVTRVRYCWGDAPKCNLFDAAGLPASPFELEVK